LVVIDTDGRIILKLAFYEKHGNMWTGFMKLKRSPVTGLVWSRGFQEV
jgi:hypothetical protein